MVLREISVKYSNFLVDKIGMGLLVLVAFSIPFPIRFNSIAIVSAFSFFSIRLALGRGFDKDFIKAPTFSLILLIFSITVVGLSYTSDLKMGLSDLERSSFLIAFLVIIYQSKIIGVNVLQLIIAFTAGCFSLMLYGIGHSLFFLNGDQRDQAFKLGHTYFTNNILIHPVYLSFYFIFIFFFLLEVIRVKKASLNNILKGVIPLGIIFIVGTLFFLRAQMSLVVFVMLLVMYAIIILKRRAWLVTFLLFTVALLVFLLDSSRVTTFFDTYGKNVSSALDQRFSVWQGTIEGIKTAPFFGGGTGGDQDLINAGYAKTGYQEGIDNSYNAHNQYLQFLAKNGLLELLLFLALLFYSFRQSLKSSNYTFLMFNMAVTLIMFTESFLDVQRGIVFFYFFLCAFIYLPYESPSQPAKNI